MQLLSFLTDHKGKRFLEGSGVCHVGVSGTIVSSFKTGCVNSINI